MLFCLCLLFIVCNIGWTANQKMRAAQSGLTFFQLIHKQKEENVESWRWGNRDQIRIPLKLYDEIANGLSRIQNVGKLASVQAARRFAEGNHSLMPGSLMLSTGTSRTYCSRNAVLQACSGSSGRLTHTPFSLALFNKHEGS